MTLYPPYAHVAPHALPLYFSKTSHSLLPLKTMLLDAFPRSQHHTSPEREGERETHSCDVILNVAGTLPRGQNPVLYTCSDFAFKAR